MMEKINEWIEVVIIFIMLIASLIFVFGGLLGGFIYLWKMILS